MDLIGAYRKHLRDTLVGALVRLLVRPVLAAVAALRRPTSGTPAGPVAAMPAPPTERAGPAERAEWEIIENTDAAWAALGGWDHQSIADLQTRKWPDFVRSVAGPGPFGRSHEATVGTIDLATHNTLVSYGYALALACSGLRQARILDWGGGVGHYAVYSRALLPDVTFDYHVRDVPKLCAAGRGLLPEVTFHDSDGTDLGSSYDFVFASSTVHYARDPYQQMKRLCALTKDRILITRTPFLETHDDILVVQRPYRYGYMTEYAGWFMNLGRFVRSVEADGFVLERQFLIGEQPYLPDFEETVRYYGLLFRRGP
jgi:putative methyltransferase (TIGR04325 family)